MGVPILQGGPSESSAGVVYSEWYKLCKAPVPQQPIDKYMNKEIHMCINTDIHKYINEYMYIYTYIYIYAFIDLSE